MSALVAAGDRDIDRSERRDRNTIEGNLSLGRDHAAIRAGSFLHDARESEPGVAALQDDRRVGRELREKRRQPRLIGSVDGAASPAVERHRIWTAMRGENEELRAANIDREQRGFRCDLVVDFDRVAFLKLVLELM